MDSETIEEFGARLALELAERMALIARLNPFDKQEGYAIHENYAEARALLDQIAAHLVMNGGPE